MIDPIIQSTVFKCSFIITSSDESIVDVSRALFLAQGFCLSKIVTEQLLDSQSVSVYVDSSAVAENLRRAFSKINVSDVSFEISDQPKDDWMNRWKENIQPFALTERFDVVPLWHKESYDAQGKEVIYIDTVSAFGTGLHETTRFTAQLIEHNIKLEDRFLDVGTGTGILSIVAAKCGASRVDAFDISESSVRVAQQNAIANQLEFHSLQTASVGKIKFDQQYDFVAANLITEDLIAFKDDLFQYMSTSGQLILSGIGVDNVNRVKEVFDNFPLDYVETLIGEKWAAILFQRRE